MSVLPTDAENLFVVLSARELNSDLYIVTRATEEGAEVKIMRAGADRVISPYHTGGIKIANAVLKPAVVEFLEFVTLSENIGLELEEITVFPNSRLVNNTLDETGIGRDFKIIIVAVKRPQGEMEFKPTSETIINAGDTLIALDESSQLRKLETLTGNA